MAAARQRYFYIIGTRKKRLTGHSEILQIRGIVRSVHSTPGACRRWNGRCDGNNQKNIFIRKGERNDLL